MDKNASLFLYELYRRMPVDINGPYLNLTSEQFYRKHRFLFEFYEDNYTAHLPADTCAEILDVGFGFGMFMVFMEQNGYKNISGVEYNLIQAENAKKMGFRAELITDLAEYLKNNCKCFDIIHVSNVVEHLPKYDLIEMFDLFRNALKDNGKLIVVVPNIAGARGVYSRYLVLGHETGFAEVSLRQIFQVADFKDINIFSSKIKPRLRIKNIIMIFFRGIFDFLVRAVDYLYLGVNRPHCLGTYLFGIGTRKN